MYLKINKEGCEGYTYKFRFDNKIQKSDYALINNEKIVFAVNEEEMMMLSGSVLDYVS
jgi:Fe-S cluster assembly iron-binding protein IscA